MSLSEISSELFKFLGQVTIVGLGWLVVHKLTIVREKEKSRRDMLLKGIDELLSAVNEIFTDARKYHSQKIRDISLEVSIKMTLQDISVQLEQKARLTNGRGLEKCNKSFIGLKRAITLVHFEDEQDGELLDDSNLQQLIVAHAVAFKRNLHELKYDEVSNGLDLGRTSFWK